MHWDGLFECKAGMLGEAASDFGCHFTVWTESTHPLKRPPSGLSSRATGSSRGLRGAEVATCAQQLQSTCSGLTILPADQAAINNHPHMHNEPRECDCNLHYTWRQLYIGLMCFAESKLLLSAFTNDTIFSSKRKGHKRAAYMGIRWEPCLNPSIAAVKFHAAQGTHCCLLFLK